MQERLQFYIGGSWIDPVKEFPHHVVDPSTEEPIGRISLGEEADVNRAVAAARAAFEPFSCTSVNERLELLLSIHDAYMRRFDDLVELVSREMGAPTWLSRSAHVASGVAHIKEAFDTLNNFDFLTIRGSTALLHEPIGVCGLIVPWNWPISQVVCKVAPALAAGCTVVLKPSEVTPLTAMALADVLHEAGVPAGVFNLVNGKGDVVGAAMARHPDIDMISFTGSTRAGVSVARASAETVKRVTQELGGNSAYIVLEDADLERAVTRGVLNAMANSGQSCNAPTRMLVPRSMSDKAITIAKVAAESLRVGDPFADDTSVGPVASQERFDAIQRLIERAVDEGAMLICGGLDRPVGLRRGYFVRPTVFANVTGEMAVGRDEVFGPVLSLMPYDDLEDAIRIANETSYGLAGYVESGSIENARAVGRRLRVGNVYLNGAGTDFSAPFGGYKQSGNGREWGEYGFRAYLEVKAILGHECDSQQSRTDLLSGSVPG